MADEYCCENGEALGRVCGGCRELAEMHTSRFWPQPDKWVRRFLGLANHIATWSKDTTKVGAVAVDPASRKVLETGYNGLPRGVEDHSERMQRPAKYLWTAHAEENLVAHAARQVLEGTTVYVTHLCCNACARMLINAGVAKVVVDSMGTTSMPAEQFDVAKAMFQEAGVELEIV